LNYVCFDEPKKKLVKPRQGIRIINRDTNPQWEKVTPYVYDGERERIYKGEGTIEFTCIQPYATEQIKMLDYYGDFNFYVAKYINLFFMAFGFCVCLFLSMTIYIFNDHFFSP
jgi:hypothetical protein